MERVITYNLNEDFTEKLAGFLCDKFTASGRDLAKVACVFGGKRPALFLRQALSRKIKGSFFPPQVFSIEEFVEYAVSKKITPKRINNLDACFFIYELTKKMIPSMLKGSFSKKLAGSPLLSSVIL